jgi:hypothetical protein
LFSRYGFAGCCAVGSKSRKFTQNTSGARNPRRIGCGYSRKVSRVKVKQHKNPPKMKDLADFGPIRRLEACLRREATNRIPDR